ncbi:MAG: hypothetical protein LUG66_00490 [Clostridiales bacterium]|nr:hypothetical protein [Clostridiales bacterium]
MLNTSYVLTCSNDFRATLENIVKGLNKAGFSRRDYRVGENTEAYAPSEPKHEYVQEELPIQLESQNYEVQNDIFDDIVPEEVKAALETSNISENSAAAVMEQEAAEAAQAYESVIADDANAGFTGGELGDMLKQNKIQPQFREEAKNLRIPQFFMKSVPDLFGDDELLEPEHLSEGFSLSGQDAQISFELATGEMYHVDIQEEGEAVPKYKRASKSESEYIREYLAKLPQDKKIQQCTDMICNQINKNNRYASSEINDYVHRIIQNMTEDELAAMETAIPVYAGKIRQKIESHENIYRERQFYKLLDSGKVICKESYAFPSVITPAQTTDAIPYSLYEAERDDMNIFEHSLIDMVVCLDNIKWWHRIIERKGFRLNAFINHYPDFMVMTKSGKLVLIEAKGDYLDGDNSKTKLKLGRQWQSQVGRMYRCFMVFKEKNLGMDGAYMLDEFLML